MAAGKWKQAAREMVAGRASGKSPEAGMTRGGEVRSVQLKEPIPLQPSVFVVEVSKCRSITKSTKNRREPRTAEPQT